MHYQYICILEEINIPALLYILMFITPVISFLFVLLYMYGSQNDANYFLELETQLVNETDILV